MEEAMGTKERDVDRGGDAHGLGFTSDRDEE